MPEDVPALLPVIFAVIGLGFIPFLAVMGTAFTKIVIVLMLLRTALGVQTAPSTLVINSIALTLTAFIMAPLANLMMTTVQAEGLTMSTWEETTEIYRIISGIFVDHLQRFAEPKELEFFMDSAKQLWPVEMHDAINNENIFVLLPAHITSELTKAFQIAFLLFLPFVVIDMVVSNVLLAMGAMMMPPMLISLPIKILLFVATDGWAKLLHSLVISYA